MCEIRLFHKGMQVFDKKTDNSTEARVGILAEIAHKNFGNVIGSYVTHVIYPELKNNEAKTGEANKQNKHNKHHKSKG